jgi:uncharacterized membrane protein YdjX (TVP38/TMEM64 family)
VDYVDLIPVRNWRNKALWKAVLFALLVLGLIAASRYFPVETWLESLIVWAEQRGASGKLIFTGAYIVAMVLCLWGTPFTLAAGVAFGLWWGTVVATVSATAGSAAAFLIARFLARGSVEAWVHRNARFKALDAAIGKRGWTIVFLTRFSPLVPFSISNYFFGITRVGFWPFVGASFLAILPGSFVVVYLGHIGRVTVLEGWGELGGWQYVLMAGALVFTIAIIVYLTRVARKAMAEVEADDTRTRMATPNAIREHSRRPHDLGS